MGISALNITGGVSTGAADALWIASGGGIDIAPAPPAALDGPPSVGAEVTLDRVEVVGNRATPRSTFPSPSGVQCPDGDCPHAGSDGGGISNSGNLVMRRSEVRRNALTNNALTTADVAPLGSVIELDGSAELSDTRIEDNPVTVTAQEGLASATAGVGVLDFPARPTRSG